MAINMTEVDLAFNQAKEHWVARRSTVRSLARFLGFPVGDIAKCLHMSRPTLATRFNGATVFEPWEIAAIAAGFGVPASVLDLNPDDAVRWVLDHPEGISRTH